MDDYTYKYGRWRVPAPDDTPEPDAAPAPDSIPEPDIAPAPDDAPEPDDSGEPPAPAPVRYSVPNGEAVTVERPAADKSHPVRNTILIVLALALVITTGLFIRRLTLENALLRGQVAAAARTVPSDGADGAGDSGDAYRSYREYFENYYSTSDSVELPRADVGTGVTVTLSPKPAQELSLAEIYERVSPAVVGVTARVNGRDYSWGTGVAFTPDGCIITNTHIIAGCDGASVTFPDGTEYDALLVGSDSASDIAVLKIDGENLPYAEFGDSSTLRVGDAVAAIGNPLGEAYAGTFTNGIISGIDRSVSNNGYSMTLLQTNAALNEGNSGGPLLNAGGQVVGITNMKIMSSYFTTVEGIGFAIPSTVVKEIADQLIEYGVVMGKPTIGITAGPVSAEAMELYGLPAGVYVATVNENADAYLKGVRPGDVITEVNGTPVTTVAEVNAIKDGLAVGDTLTLTLWREGETFTLDIALVDSSVIN